MDVLATLAYVSGVATLLWFIALTVIWVAAVRLLWLLGSWFDKDQW